MTLVSVKRNPSWIYGLLVIFLVLVGYHEYFFGANAFFKEDWVAVSSHTHGNKDSNGWRADRGFGISNYFGDPAMWHPWGPLSWLEKICPSQAFAYNVSVVLFSVMVALAIFFAIRWMYPSFNPFLAAVLAPAVIFSTDQSAYYLARAFAPYVASIPLVIFILYQFFESRKLIYYFYFALLAFAVTFLGNIWCLTQMFSIGFFFTCGYCYYFKKSFWKHFQSLMGLYAFAGVSTLCVGAWAFYSFILEKIWVGYVREKVFTFDTNVMPDLKGLMTFIPGIFLAEYMPQNNFLAGFWGRQAYMNFLPFFVMVFWLSFKVNTRTFWSFIVRFLLCVYFINQLLMYSNFPPLVGRIISYISNVSSKLFVPFDFIFPLQLFLVVDFLIAWRTQTQTCGRSIWRLLSQWSAWIAISSYGLVLMCVAFAYINSELFKDCLGWLLSVAPERILPGGREFMLAVMDYNVSRLTETFQPVAVLYVLSAVIVCVPFLRPRNLEWLRRLPLGLMAGFILCQAFLLAWGLFPSNRTPLFWEELARKEGVVFNPTDRFYFVKDDVFPRTLEGFQNRWSNVDGLGFKERLLGIEQTPGLNISGFKSFTTKREKEFIDQMFNADGQNRVTKRLYYGAPLIGSDLMNMAAVNYYFSENKYTDLPEGIERFYDTKGLHIYRNRNAWPYFYLANALQVVRKNEILSNPKRGFAYVEDSTIQMNHHQDSTISLRTFKHGEMIFDVEAHGQEFFVVADAWHPLWKAYVDGKPVPVYKANFIFKGVHLEPGNYTLRMLFDNSAYKTGINISICAWIIFLMGFVWAVRKEQRLVTKNT